MTKTERLADNRRRAKEANKKFNQAEARLKDYLNSAEVKRLRKDVSDAIDAINELVYEWNDIITEDSLHFKKDPQ